jgi:membrane protein implicated in regulation of membrane protease activity
MRHFLFLLPFIALLLFFLLPPGQATFISVPFFLVFVWLAWVTWKDMRRPVSTGIEGLMGGKAQVVGKTRDGAKVSLRGELWDAVSDDELTMGDTVRVTRFERMKLVVRKDVNSRG